MGMQVRDFSGLAGTGGGTFRVDSGSGELKVGNKGFFGRIAGWFRMKSDPGTVRGENMAAMNAFIRAIGQDPKYGPEFANMAARTLTPLLERGKPLTSRMVRQIVGDIQRQQSQVNGLNRTLAMRFSEYDIHGDPNCFGSVFANVCAEKGFNIPLERLDVSRLGKAIATGIQEAGRNGQHAVSIEEAKEIARQESARFVEGRQALFEHIDGMNASEADKSALKELVCKFGHIRKPEYLDQVLSLKQAGHELFRALNKPECSRTEILQAIAKYNEAYGAAFAKIRDRATGADDVVRFGGDALDFALSTSGLSAEDRRHLYELLTSQSSRELRQALSFIGIKQSDIKGVSERSAQMTMSIMGRSQEFVSELATTLGLSIGLTREQTFEALEEPPVVFDGWLEIPKDIGDFARTLGATVPTGLDEIRRGMADELSGHRGEPVQILRGNTDVSKNIGRFMGNHGKPCLDHALKCLEEAKRGGGDAQAIYQRFLTAFVGGTTQREVLSFVGRHPELFGPVRELARTLHSQGLEGGGRDHAFYSVQNSVFLRGLVPALTMHNFDGTDPNANRTEREVGRLLQNGIGGLRGSAPDPLLKAFFGALTHEEVDPERLETRFSQLADKLLSHPTSSVDDETGPLRAPQGFAREVVDFQRALAEMRGYCETLGVNFAQTFPNVNERLASVATHLAGVVKPGNLMLGELNHRQLGQFESALKALSVEYPQTSFRTERDTRLTPAREAYRDSIVRLAALVRAGNPEDILRGLQDMLRTGDVCLRVTNDLGGRVDDADKIKQFRMDMFREAVTRLPEQDVLDVVGLLGQPAARIFVDGLIDAAYGILDQENTLGKRVLSAAVGLGELRSAVAMLAEERGVKLPLIPDTKQYTLNDLLPSQRTAIRNVFGLSCEGGKTQLVRGTVNERFMTAYRTKLNEPRTEDERAMHTLRGGEQAGVTEQFWKDFSRRSNWNISDTGGTRALYATEGFETLSAEERESRLLDGVRQLRELCGNDPEMLKFVTQYSHQGLFAGILEGCGDPQSCPLRLLDGRSGLPMPREEKQTFTFSRTESGDIAVKASWRAGSLDRLMTSDGKVVDLDPASSCQFDFEVTFTRDMRVVVSQPIVFDFDLRLR